MNRINHLAMEVKIYDANGKVVAERVYYPRDEKIHYEFDLSSEDKGIYFVNIIVDNEVKSKKLLLK
ncbi:MAG TPA: T9SS type A sorting domain-containing protein [Bacteroidales bacterium]|nr:T9SS type A sorting domain-containing protein [Bacteroidales bacterium]